MIVINTLPVAVGEWQFEAFFFFFFGGSTNHLCFQEFPCVTRDKTSYLNTLSHVLKSGGVQHGIKRSSLQSKYFCPVENFAADFHHDILEGVVPYILKIVLQVCTFCYQILCSKLF